MSFPTWLGIQEILVYIEMDARFLGHDNAGSHISDPGLNLYGPSLRVPKPESPKISVKTSISRTNSLVFNIFP